MILEPLKIKSVTVSNVSPSICPEVMGPDAMILVFWLLSFKPTFHSPLLLSSRGSLVLLLFLPWGWCYLHIWGYWYFSWQSWFQLVSSSPAFLMMYSAYKLNKHGANVQPWCIPFLWTPFPWLTPWTLSTFAPILSQSLLHASLFVNMHAPPKPLHEYACTLSLQFPQFCYWEGFPVFSVLGPEWALWTP